MDSIGGDDLINYNRLNSEENTGTSLIKGSRVYLLLLASAKYFIVLYKRSF